VCCTSSSVPTASATTRTDAEPLLVVRDLSVAYPDGTRALTDVTFAVARGTIFGLLGPNGAGKSTLLRVLATLQRPHSGAITLNGVDALAAPARARELLGFLPQDFGFPPALSVLEILDHVARLKGFENRTARADAVHDMLLRVNLADDTHRRAKTLSGGMKQRLGLAIAMLGHPHLLVVDEPTVALDPHERYRIHDLLSELAETRTVLFSTHLVSDVDALCRTVMLLHRGRVVRHGAPADLAAALRGSVFRAQIPRHDAPRVRQVHRVIRESLMAGEVQMTVRAETAPDARFSLVEPSLEDVFADATAPD
jgi:ABC-2 type transport system ATP-binding protein